MPLRATDARRLIRRLLDEGKFIVPGAGTHARKEIEIDIEPIGPQDVEPWSCSPSELERQHCERQRVAAAA